MCKVKIRKEFVILKGRYSFNKCQKIIKQKFDYDVSVKTLRRWWKIFEEGDWSCEDKSTKPKNIHYKINKEIENKVLKLRKKTNYGAEKLSKYNLGIGKNSINKILKKHNLLRKEHNRGKRVKWVRFERKHTNSLWHIDDSEFLQEGKIIAVVDDYSRYCLGLLHTDTVTTKIVCEFLEKLFLKYGKPSQLISDNGAPYGLYSKYSKFDKFLKFRKIEHIRTRVRRPQTNGKVERLFQTLKKEFELYNDLEKFRYNYNCQRLHSSLNYKVPLSRF